MPSKYTAKGCYSAWRDEEDAIIEQWYSLEIPRDVTARVNKINRAGQPVRTLDAVRRRASILEVKGFRSKHATRHLHQTPPKRISEIRLDPIQKLATCGRWV